MNDLQLLLRVCGSFFTIAKLVVYVKPKSCFGAKRKTDMAVSIYMQMCAEVSKHNS